MIYRFSQLASCFCITVSVCTAPLFAYAETDVAVVDIPAGGAAGVTGRSADTSDQFMRVSDYPADGAGVAVTVPAAGPSGTSPGAAAPEHTADTPYAPDQIIVVYDDSVVSARSADTAGVSDTFLVSAGGADIIDTAADALESGMSEIFSAHAEGATITDRAVLDEFSTDTEILSFSRNIDVAAAADALRAVDGIAHAQPNFIYTTHTSPPPSDDPLISDSGSWPFTFLNLADVYDFMPAGAAFRGVSTPIVGIVDTNIKTSHPELAGSLWRPSSCFDDTGALIDSNCPNGGLGTARRGGARVITDDPEAGFGTHGTRMAGVALGGFNNGKGGTGIAQHSKLMALAAPFSTTAAYRIGKVYTDDATRLINAARRNGVSVLNLSWGLEYDSDDYTLNCADEAAKIASGHDALLYDALVAFPGVITASAGNSGKQTGTTGTWVRPADYAKTMRDGSDNLCWEGIDALVPVGGVTSANRAYGSTNYGTHVGFLAPGAGVLTPSYKVGYYGYGQGTGLRDGTAVSVAASSWTSGTDTDSGPYISPVPSSGDASAASSYTVGPIDLSFIDTTRGEYMTVTLRHACESQRSNPPSERVFLPDGREIPEVGPGNRRRPSVDFSADGVTYYSDQDGVYPIGFPSSNQIRTITFRGESGAKYMTENFYLRFIWTGSDTAGLTKEDCKIFIDDNTVSFGGPLRSDLTHDGELLRGYYGTAWGTSVSSAAAAGAFAVLFEAKPDLTATEAVEIMRTGAGTLGGMQQTIRAATVPNSQVSDGGRVLNILGALRELKRRHPSPWYSLDFDSSGSFDARRDSTLLYLHTAQGLDAAALASFTDGGTERDASEAITAIRRSAAGAGLSLDFDGSGKYEPRYDGVLLYLHTNLGLSATTLTPFTHNNQQSTASSAIRFIGRAIADSSE